MYDLEDPQIEKLWFEGRYEIIDGVLTTMRAAYFVGMRPLQELIFVPKAHLKKRKLPDDFGGEVDIVIDEDRVVRADSVWLTREDQRRQKEAARRSGKSDRSRTRILTPPTRGDRVDQSRPRAAR